MGVDRISLTVGFVDLSSFDELEVFFYGGRSKNAFRKSIRRSSWFTLIASQLNRPSSSPNFGEEFVGIFSRSGDYIRDVWMRCTIPAIKSKRPYQARWTTNLGHNLIEEAYLQFNDLQACRITSQYMDFWSAFTLTKSKDLGYQNMIGSTLDLTSPYLLRESNHDANAGTQISQGPVDLPSKTLNIPIPFPFTRSSEDSLCHAMAPFNDIKIHVKLRKLADLLHFDLLGENWMFPYDATADGGVAASKTKTAPVAHNVADNLVSSHSSVIGSIVRNVGAGSHSLFGAAAVTPDAAVENYNTLKLTDVQLWCHYAIIPNMDRDALGDEVEHDVIVEQYHHVNPVPWSPATANTLSVDIRMSHSIRHIMFGVQNTTIHSEWSNYGTHHTVPVCAHPNSLFNERSVAAVRQGSEIPGNEDPIARASLQYEGVDRVNMTWDYFSFVVPFYTCPAIPEKDGFHILNYGNNITEIQPGGSTNLSRIAHTVLALEASPMAKALNSETHPGLIALPQNSTLKKAFDDKKSAISAYWAADNVNYRDQFKNTYNAHIILTGITLQRYGGGTVGYPII